MISKRITISLTLAAGVAALAFTSASARNMAWENDHENYEFKHPMAVTCSDFIATEQVYQSYVTAWVTGQVHGVDTIEVVDDYEPVSVPEVVEQCKSAPDKNVSDVVRTMVKGHE